MANLIIKPTSGGSLVLQDEGGDAAITVGATGTTTFAENATLSGTANNIGTVTAGTISAAIRPGIRQFIQNSTTTETDGSFTGGTEYTITNMNVAITPKASNSRIFVTLGCGGMSQGAVAGVALTIKRITGGVTTVVRNVSRYGYQGESDGWEQFAMAGINILDSPTIPSTPIEIVYQMYVTATTTGNFEINPNSSGNYHDGVMTAMEIGPN